MMAALVGVLGCASPPRAPPDLAADTELACARAGASAWSQIVFRTEVWRELALRADAGEADAFEAIADHMQTNLEAGKSRCDPTRIQTLRDTATRLRHARGEPASSSAAFASAARPPAEAGGVRGDSGAPQAPRDDAVSPFGEAEARPHAGRSTPKVRMGSDGRFAIVRRVMRRSRAEFRRCYSQALERHEEPAATAIEFVIAASGQVEQTSFEQGSTGFDACMDRALKHLRFPQDVGRLIIRYPLTELPR